IQKRNRMTIINKKHPDIQENASGRNLVFLSLQNDKDIYFTNTAARKFNLQAGKYLHFINEEKEWFFIQNDDKDGFMLNADGKSSSRAVIVINKPLVSMFRKSTGFTGPVRLCLMKTSKIYKDQPMV